MVSLIQPSFAKGELAPALYGRVDTAAYQVGLRTARNCIVHSYGGVSNRAGLLFLGPVKDHTKTPRLLDFQFKTTDAYVLEFGHEYMRVIREDGHVTETAKVITAITEANPGVVTAVAHGYVAGEEVFIDDVVGMVELNGRRFTVGTTTTDTFQLKDQVTGANVDTTGYTTYVSDGTAARIYEIETPYQEADLFELKWVQNADVMTLTHKNYPIHELSRFGHANWVLEEAAFEPEVPVPTGQTVTPSPTGAVTRRYRVTATARVTLEESLPALNTTTRTITAITKANPAVVTSNTHGFSNGDEVELNGIVGMTELNGRRFIARNVATNTFELEGEDSTNYTTYGSGGTANQTFVRITNGAATANDTITWAAPTLPSGVEIEKYSIYLEDNGLFGLIGETENLTFTNDNIEADLDITPPKARNPFRGAGNWPGTAGYYEQRRVLGGSDDKPDTSNFSQTGSASNFSTSSPLQADDAITATLNSNKVNEIRHYVAGNDLITLTSGAEWKINSGTDSAFSPTTIKQKPQSYWGASHNRPIIVGGTILFAQENERIIRSLGYSLQVDGYTGNDMTTLASHIFENYSLKDWAFSRSPDPIVHCVRTDGRAAAMTFNQEQQVIAWTTWDTKGKFESVAVIRPDQVTTDDAGYFVVKRRIGGQTVRYIERTHSRRFTDVRDCFFVDSGASYDDPVDITDVSLADPVLVTAPAHGFSNGDQVDIFDIEWEPEYDNYDNEEQPDQLNTRRYKVAGVTTDTFTLQTLNGAAVDGTEFTQAYVESGTVRKAVQVISGLWHLAGQDVVALADGNVLQNLTIDELGQLALPRRFSRVHVGLKYISDIELLDIEAPTGSGTISGKLKKISSVVVRFLKSRGLFLGPTKYKLVEMKQREDENMGDPTQLLTGPRKQTLTPDWSTNGRIFFRQRYPLPLTILSITPDIITEDTGANDG
jgi:hypothetical protein